METFDVGILRRFARLNEIAEQVMVFDPARERVGDELRAIVTPNGAEKSVLLKVITGLQSGAMGALLPAGNSLARR